MVCCSLADVEFALFWMNVTALFLPECHLVYHEARSGTFYVHRGRTYILIYVFWPQIVHR